MNSFYVLKPDISDIPSLRVLWKRAFSDTDEFLDGFFNTAFSTERCRCVKNENLVIAALYIFDCIYRYEKLAYIYAVATLPEHRGKGIGKALIKETLKQLEKLGYCGAILVPSDDKLFDFYEKLNFKTACYVDKIECFASENPVPLRTVNAKEYGMLRKKYLGDSAVFQEDENLDFLALGAELYEGDCFLLACRRENGVLFGIELLGNNTYIKDIVYTLGCKRGVFRTAGKNIPFAMHYPIHCMPAPDYFGLAFD